MTEDGRSATTATPEPSEASPPRPVPGWAVVVRGDKPAWRRVAESLLTVADGRIGTRGTREENGTAAHAGPLVMAAGVHRTGDDGPEPLPGPLWFQLSVPAVEPDRDLRWVDLRDGVLHRTGTGIRSLRFACLARPGTLVQQVETDVPVSAAAPLALPPTPGVTATAHIDGDVAWTEVEGRGGITAAATTDRRPHGTELRRVTVMHGGVTAAPPAEPVRVQLETARTRGVDRLLAEQRSAWAERWANAEVEVDGDDEVQHAIRFALFHLMASVADTGEAAVGARGLTGPAYAGHVFWDADVHVLPFLAATHPAASRAMLEYRVARLPAARARARAEGHPGARFPWESAEDGTEVTPRSWTSLDGTRVPIRTGEQELHVTADIAWAAWHHVLWSGDDALLDGPARALVTDTAAWWASRLEVDPDGSAHLRGVIGPDEYHEDVDDNAYTNVMAAWNLRRGADLLDEDDTAAAGDDTARRWRQLAGALVTGRRPDGAGHEQFAGFDELEEVDLATLATPPFAADVLLGHARVGRTQVIKQADVLMLHHLVPDDLPPGTLVADLDHYLPRTSHGSSLSPGVHASLLARAGRPDEAARWLRLAARLDLDDLTGTTAGGLHLATMGTMWQALVFGFLGARPGRAALEVDPRPLPSSWRRLAVRLRFHGRRLELELQSDRLRIGSDAPVPVTTPGRRRPLTAPLVLVHRADTWRPEDHHAT